MTDFSSALTIPLPPGVTASGLRRCAEGIKEQGWERPAAILVSVADALEASLAEPQIENRVLPEGFTEVVQPVTVQQALRHAMAALQAEDYAGSRMWVRVAESLSTP